MEALVLAGLLGAGYLINKEEEDKDPITKPMKKIISVPNGENVYNSDRLFHIYIKIVYIRVYLEKTIVFKRNA